MKLIIQKWLLQEIIARYWQTNYDQGLLMNLVSVVPEQACSSPHKQPQKFTVVKKGVPKIQHSCMLSFTEQHSGQVKTRKVSKFWHWCPLSLNRPAILPTKQHENFTVVLLKQDGCHTFKGDILQIIIYDQSQKFIVVWFQTWLVSKIWLWFASHHHTLSSVIFWIFP